MDGVSTLVDAKRCLRVTIFFFPKHRLGHWVWVSQDRVALGSLMNRGLLPHLHTSLHVSGEGNSSRELIDIELGIRVFA